MSITLRDYYLQSSTEMPSSDAGMTEDIVWIRTAALKLSDWTQLPDSPLSEQKKAEWATYRQVMRDITNNLPDDLLDTVFIDAPE